MSGSKHLQHILAFALAASLCAGCASKPAASTPTPSNPSPTQKTGLQPGQYQPINPNAPAPAPSVTSPQAFDQAPADLDGDGKPDRFVLSGNKLVMEPTTLPGTQVVANILADNERMSGVQVFDLGLGKPVVDVKTSILDAPSERLLVFTPGQSELEAVLPMVRPPFQLKVDGKAAAIETTSGAAGPLLRLKPGANGTLEFDHVERYPATPLEVVRLFLSGVSGGLDRISLFAFALPTLQSVPDLKGRPRFTPPIVSGDQATIAISFIDREGVAFDFHLVRQNEQWKVQAITAGKAAAQ